LQNPLDVLVELHRIAKDKGIVHLTAPHFSSVDYFTDPTHKHPLTSRSFDYLIPGTQLYNLCYKSIVYKKREVRITFLLPPIIRHFMSWLVSKNMLFYERHFAFIFPAHQIIFDLEVVKNG
jgi:hypothetical protein